MKTGGFELRLYVYISKCLLLSNVWLKDRVSPNFMLVLLTKSPNATRIFFAGSRLEFLDSATRYRVYRSTRTKVYDAVILRVKQCVHDIDTSFVITFVYTYIFVVTFFYKAFAFLHFF